MTKVAGAETSELSLVKCRGRQTAELTQTGKDEAGASRAGPLPPASTACWLTVCFCLWNAVFPVILR